MNGGKLAICHEVQTSAVFFYDLITIANLTHEKIKIFYIFCYLQTFKI